MKLQTQDYHVLLIGIDAYGVKPLHGCVNDIDAIQRLLLGDRVAIPKESIQRLASPHPGCRHETTVDSAPATLANMRAALESLGSGKVKENDRVFIYYSGHGARTRVNSAAGAFDREALVPVDFDAQPGTPQLLFDFDVNRLLAAIVRRTSAVTFVLDCCHSAGATRELPVSGMTSRVMEHLGGGEPIWLPLKKDALASASMRGVAGNVDDCQIVAACLNHELAQESTGSDGVRHGLLTRALVEQLQALPDSNLRDVPWGRIWEGVRVNVEAASVTQHVWLAGSAASAVLAGPRIDGDAGFTIRRPGPNNAYTIDAGTLAGLTKGAKVAAYKASPLRFPPLNSDDDKQARFTDVLLEVTEAARASATAAAKGAPFEVPPGARARLVEPGAPGRLRCAVAPRNKAITDSLASSALLQIVDERNAEALLKRQDDDTWVLVDDIHGAKLDYPVLCRVNADQLGLAARLMEQYYYYSLPLRMVESCIDLPGALQLNLLNCPADRPLSVTEQDGIGLPEVESGAEFRYELHVGDKVAIRIRNSSKERLKVTLLNSAGSGRVEYLGEQIIDAKAHFIFWRANTRGEPFPATTPKGVDQGIDRLVAIGTTAYDKDFRYFKLESRFADILESTRSGVAKDLDDIDSMSPPLERWTTCHAVLRCRA